MLEINQRNIRRAPYIVQTEVAWDEFFKKTHAGRPFCLTQNNRYHYVRYTLVTLDCTDHDNEKVNVIKLFCSVDFLFELQSI